MNNIKDKRTGDEARSEDLREVWSKPQLHATSVVDRTNGGSYSLNVGGDDGWYVS